MGVLKVLTEDGYKPAGNSGGSALPTVSAEDDGKILMVKNGEWKAVSLPNAEGVSF